MVVHSPARPGAVQVTAPRTPEQHAAMKDRAHKTLVIAERDHGFRDPESNEWVSMPASVGAPKQARELADDVLVLLALLDDAEKERDKWREISDGLALKLVPEITQRLVDGRARVAELEAALRRWDESGIDATHSFIYDPCCPHCAIEDELRMAARASDAPPKEEPT
jgi:hypothetical protein